MLIKIKLLVVCDLGLSCFLHQHKRKSSNTGWWLNHPHLGRCGLGPCWGGLLVAGNPAGKPALEHLGNGRIAESPSQRAQCLAWREPEGSEREAGWSPFFPSARNTENLSNLLEINGPCSLDRSSQGSVPIRLPFLLILLLGHLCPHQVGTPD